MISELAADLAPVTVEKNLTHYIFYNEWDGEILRVTKTLPEKVTDAYIKTDNLIAKKLLKGDLNEKDHIVAFVNEEELDVIPRDDKLRLRSSEKTLHQLSREYIHDWDVRAKIYLKNNKLLLEINPASIAKLTRMTFKKELLLNIETDLTLYLTKHNDPNFFIEKLDVNAVELLDKGNILYDLAGIHQFINLTDLGILTRRCFKNYHVEFINESLNVVQNSLIKNRSFIHEKVLRNFPYPHLSIEKEHNTIIVKKNIPNSELEDLGLLEKTLKLYVVGSQPDEYYGQLHIDIEKLKQQGMVDIPIDADLQDVNLLYNKHRLIISIKDRPDE